MQKLDLNKFIPGALKNETLSGLVSNVFNKFVSEEQSVSINGRIGLPLPGDARIKAENLDRKLNALVPAIYYKTGSEDNVFTFEDFLKKLEVLGADTNNLDTWLSQRYYNFSPPINYDKFINYTNYFWVGKELPQAEKAKFANWNKSVDPEYYVIEVPTAAGTLNSWQVSNKWVHRDDLEAASFNISSCIQATRPIIEYSADIELNTFYASNTKTRFNEIPQFNLYNYDGTSRNQTSGIFFYSEDPSVDIDEVLRKRIRKDASSNFVFEIGLIQDDCLLYFKSANANVYKSIWSAGPIINQLSPIEFNGESTGAAVIDEITVSPKAKNQQWKIVAFNDYQFNVIGSLSGHVGVASVGQVFQCDDLTLSISGGNVYNPGDSITFRVNGPEKIRYVKEDSHENVIDFPGGKSQDTAGVGTWLAPPQLFQNMLKETRSTITFNQLAAHFSSVIENQHGFKGFGLGTNNVRTLQFSPGLGGIIRNFDGNLPLLFSMMAQKHVSPLAVLDFAENQYNNAISSVDQFIAASFSQFLSSGQLSAYESINSSSSFINSLELAFEASRDTDETIKSVFFDTTAKVKNWPVTLPMIGLIPREQPGVVFDFELGLDVIKHHDGHISPAVKRDIDFEIEIVRTKVNRSDGLMTSGIISDMPPSTPYARMLWFNSATYQLNFFNVEYDTSAEPVVAENSFWFNRLDGQLKKGVNGSWVNASDEMESRWQLIDLATIRNNLIIAIEQKLFDSVSSTFDTSLSLDLSGISETADLQEAELSKFANKYNYDTFAPDYDATDAFTWNYKNAPIPGVDGTTPTQPVMKSRWFDVYKEYFKQFNSGASITCRPNLEPWRLLGEVTKPADWDDNYRAPFSLLNIDTSVLPYTKPVRAVLDTEIDVTATFTSAITADSLTLGPNERILIVNQVDSTTDGIYKIIFSSGSYTLEKISSDIADNTVVAVSEGDSWQGTQWIFNEFKPYQLRLWSNEMWSYIKQTVGQNVKLCVNTKTDELLPPYVSASRWYSAEALFTTIPDGISDSYEFGQNGPIEIVWKKSLERNYALARNYFRLSPLTFIDRAWGFTYVNTYSDSSPVERNTLNILPPSKFLLHGEKLHRINYYTADDVKRKLNNFSPSQNKVEFEVVFCHNDVTIMDVIIDGVKSASLTVNTPKYIPELSLTDITVKDEGVPFSEGEKLIITRVNNQSVYSHRPASKMILNGVGQWFTNLLRFNYIDSFISDAASAYRKWDCLLCHRTGSLVKPGMNIIGNDGSISPTLYDVIFKQSKNTDSKWLTALRVQLVDMGPAYDYDNPSNKFIVKNGENLYVPADDASTWVFRLEGYNPQYPFLEYYQLADSNSDPFQTFSALNGQKTSKIWKRFTKKTSIQKVTLPLIVTGLQNVLNIIFGYLEKLQEENWNFDSIEYSKIDEETGRNINWQLEIEKFIDRVYGGMSAGEGHILNPFMGRITINTPRGLLSTFEQSNFIDTYATQAAYDVSGNIIPVNKLTISRTDAMTTVTSLTPIFSAHTFIDEFEHVIIFKRDSRTFDSFLGSHLNTAFIDYVRQDSLDKKPIFNGFFLRNNDARRNIVSSIDNIGNYYDAAKTFSEETTASHALTLLGFEKKPYFEGLTLSKNSQFNFWRGLIQSKGTNMSVDAFLKNKKFLDASIDEFWAYKIAEFGDARENSVPEIKIESKDVTKSLTRFQFYDIDDLKYVALPQFIQVSNIDDSRWHTIEDLGTVLKFEAEQIEEIVEVGSDNVFPCMVKLKNIFHNGDYASASVTKVLNTDAKSPAVYAPNSASVINATTIKVSSPGFYKVKGFTWKNPTKFSPLKLFDYSENTLIKEIGLWHPAIGIHAHEPLSLINHINDINPAFYNYETLTLSNPSFKTLKPWGKKEVGKVWWNTKNLQYVPYYDAKIFSSLEDRELNWGKLADWATVDVYEWIESPVHPSQYNALALAQEGSIDIDASIRAGGKVAVTKNYFRDRIIQAKPIAWSQLGAANGDGHPAFGPAEFTKIYVAGTSIVSDRGQLADIGIESGKSLAAWKNDKPYGEIVVGTELSYVIGSSLNITSAAFSPSGFISSMKLSFIDDRFSSVKLGNITIKTWLDRINDRFIGTENNPEEVLVDKYYIRMSDANGFYEDIPINTWFSDDINVNGIQAFRFDNFGVILEITRSEDSPQFLLPKMIAEGISGDHDVYIRQAVNFTQVLPLPDSILINDENDPDYALYEYGWRCWNSPSQAELDNDLLYSPRKWKPYVGDSVVVSATPEIIQDIKSGTYAFTLRDKTVFSRFSTNWGDWSEITDQVVTKISDGDNYLQHTFVTSDDELDVERIKIYVNGVIANSSDYDLTGKTVSIISILPAGYEVRFVYMGYQPSSDETSFNPDVEDDITVQRHYKQDYEYSYFDTYDDTGNIPIRKYYFWVKDKTVANPKHSMSLVRAKTILKSGMSEYCMLSRATKQDASAYFDSCSIYGLSRLVTKDNSFKIRFIRNFTLRDDPEEMRLKNVHAEWKLIRRGQRRKIPKSLWTYLVNAVCAQDEGGNRLPFQNRIDYDIKNGTSSRFGFGKGQIFADPELMRASVINSIINTSLFFTVGSSKVSDSIHIESLNLPYADWEEAFLTASSSRETMEKIWSACSQRQINDIFFNALEDAHTNNYELTDIFKTSMFALNVKHRL